MLQQYQRLMRPLKNRRAPACKPARQRAMARPLREGPREDDLSTLRELWPNVAAALQWIDRWADRALRGQGYVYAGKRCAARLAARCRRRRVRRDARTPGSATRIGHGRRR